jgi:hypothetical protein
MTGDTGVTGVTGVTGFTGPAGVSTTLATTNITLPTVQVGAQVTYINTNGSQHTISGTGQVIHVASIGGAAFSPVTTVTLGTATPYSNVTLAYIGNNAWVALYRSTDVTFTGAPV